MSRRGNTAASLQNSTNRETSFRAFAYNNLTPEKAKRWAAILLDHKDLLQNIHELPPEDQTRFINKVDQAYTAVDSRTVKAINALGDVCSATERLPSSAILAAGLEKRSAIAVATGGITDIWRGEHYGSPVAIKAFRIYPAQNLKAGKKILWNRVPVWQKLSHPNILPFRGVTATHSQPALVYDWGHYGNITRFVKSNPHVSRASLLLGAAEGLKYLHSLDIPHGNVKGANVVVDQKGHARLTEYGLAPINSDPRFTEAIGSSRWQAPEIIRHPRKGASTPVIESKAADVFAFAMLALEVYTEKVPFQGQEPAVAASRVLRGERPEIPKNAAQIGLTPDIWKFLERCWNQNPKKRPKIKEVVRMWQKLVDAEGDGAVNDTQTFLIPISTLRDQPRRTPPTEGPSLPQPGGPIPRAVKRCKKWILGLF